MDASRFKVAGATFAALLVTLAMAAQANASTPGEFVIPVGDVATISNAAFGDNTINPGNCPADQLAYGYQLSTGANVQLAAGAGCQSVSGATIGPFTTLVQLRVFLNDVGCGDTFYSDGNHALVSASNPWTWTVSLMDSNLCTMGPGVPRVPVAPGTGNFNATVTLTPVTPRAVCATTRALVAATTNDSPLRFQLRTLVSLVQACLAIDRVTASPSAQNLALIAQYESCLATLVQGGWLTADDETYLAAAANAL